jgi:hypothetical protein
MRGLAEFIMRGRTQALVVSCLSAGTVFFFWLGAAAVALVTLRKGVTEGLQVLVWAVLPAAAVLYFGKEFAPLAALLGSFVCAAVLRQTITWSSTLLAASLCGLVTGLALLFFAGDYIAMIKQVVDDIFTQWQAQLAAEGETLPIVAPSAEFIVGVFALVNALTVVVCVVLARYWQALLYNPGGFREEFHRVRLPAAISLPLLLISLACLAQGGSWLPWAYLAAVPCLVAGISLVHGVAGIKHLKGHWLVLFYIVLVLINPVKELVIIAGVIDSWVNFRQRLVDKTGGV